MELGPYVEALRRELLTAAEVAGDEVRAAADRLLAAMESSVRLVLIDALSAAAEHITADMAPGSVEVRLRGRDPEFVVSLPAPREPPGPPPPPSPPSFPDAEDGTRARISLRLPDELKVRIEEAAGSIGASVNSWLVHALNDAVSGIQDHPGETSRDRHHGRRMSGWVR
jgi:hypothetical protein